MLSPMKTLYTYFPLVFFYRITILIILIFVVGIIVYELYYRKKIQKYKAIAIDCLTIYTSFLLFLAVLSRRSLDYYRFGINFTDYYKSLFLYTTQDIFLEFVLNIAVFIPMGIIAYFVFSKRKFFYSLLSGFLLSFVIELSQLVLKSGYVAFTDIVHNTFGTLIGIGIAALLVFVYKKIKSKLGVNN